MTRDIRAPRGSSISCRGWVQEAALRMLMNNLDPEVAERPQDLVVYGGAGKAARNWECFDRLVTCLQKLGDDETLLVQSGKPVGILRTHAEAPRILIANSNLVGRLILSAGLGGMGGAQPLAATMNGAVFLGVEVDPARARRRLEMHYLNAIAKDLDEALGLCAAAKRNRESRSVALIANAADVYPELVKRGLRPDLVTDQTAA